MKKMIKTAEMWWKAEKQFMEIEVKEELREAIAD